MLTCHLSPSSFCGPHPIIATPTVTLLPFAPALIPHDSPHPLAAGQRVVVWRRLPRQAIVSLPGSRRSLKVCMLMTSSVFTRAGGGGLCLSRRWHLRETLSSSTTALQKDLCGEKKTKWVAGPRTPARQQQLQSGPAWRPRRPRFMLRIQQDGAA